MTTKWSFPELENFDDIVDAIGRRNIQFEFLTARSAQRPMKCGFTIYLYPSGATLARNFLIKALRADNWQFGFTFEQLAQLLAQYYTWVYPEHVTKIEPVAKSAFEEGRAYFERNKESLIRRFEGQYIAIWENDVLDSDTSFSSLAQRVYEELGYISVYMPFVTSKPRVLRFESPKHRRLRTNAS